MIGSGNLDVITTLGDLKVRLSDWRDAGDHIALVATSGNLHDGHLSLIEVARQHAERVVVSIFVHPSQAAGTDESDLIVSPLERDHRRLKIARVDLAFAPELETLYPFGIENSTTVSVPVLSEELCATSRPGRFEGVTSVISRLFALIQPDVAVFGQKDFQQQLIVRRMTDDLNLPIRIVSAPICREKDGLAMSSVNQSIPEASRPVAAELFRVLTDVARRLSSGERDFDKLEARAVDDLAALGFVPEYVSIRRAEDLQVPDRDGDELVILGAAQLGDVRLIDNVLVYA